MSASAIFSLNDAMRYPLARLPQWVRASILRRPSFVRFTPISNRTTEVEDVAERPDQELTSRSCDAAEWY
jgi:hypothetical protein